MFHLNYNAMSNKTSKVSIAKNAGDMVALGHGIFKKHTSEGENSPLKAIPGFDAAKFNAMNMEIEAINNDAEDLKKRSEQRYRDRDNKMEPMEEQIRQIKNLLKAVYAKNPKELGLWGFDVTDSIKGKPGPKQ